MGSGPTGGIVNDYQVFGYSNGQPLAGGHVTRSRVTIGVDLGQRSDPTAIVVCEETLLPVQGRTALASSYTARDLGRLPIGTPYPEVAKRVAGVVDALLARRVGNLRLIVDSTGVGIPVVELIKEALRGKACRLIPATFTYGERLIKNENGDLSVGKAYLVSRLQALLQTGRLKLPVTAESKALAKELADYEIRVDQDANDKYGAFKVGTHDDLVTALGLAVLIPAAPSQAPVVGGTNRVQAALSQIQDHGAGGGMPLRPPKQ